MSKERWHYHGATARKQGRIFEMSTVKAPVRGFGEMFSTFHVISTNRVAVSPDLLSPKNFFTHFPAENYRAVIQYPRKDLHLYGASYSEIFGCNAPLEAIPPGFFLETISSELLVAYSEWLHNC